MMRRNYVATILFDLDDVLADFLSSLIERYNFRYNDSLMIDDVTQWDLSKVVKKECGSRIYDFYQEPGLFRYLKPKEHATEVLKRLIDTGFEIVIVSDAPAGHSYDDFVLDKTKITNPSDDKRKWISENLPMIDKNNIVFTSQKWRIMGDILVDDRPDTFNKFQELGRNAILMDQPYNQEIDTKQRARNLLEAEQMIYSYLNMNQMNPKGVLR
ncbi:hypothetical protein [Paenibacillus sp. OV219]|uniref:5' nucleotidase, NT5C type n=1 Tax=Paenibacillus sp. OV219 TaxID=1884377 RepID=UPI0008D4105B|nr:hypothetical protein [Paenibacillus sp. OV219]SEM87540.1 5'(3')-deoxyribonucleotidase [Paenibacillus sp. OV219]